MWNWEHNLKIISQSLCSFLPPSVCCHPWPLCSVHLYTCTDTRWSFQGIKIKPFCWLVSLLPCARSSAAHRSPALGQQPQSGRKVRIKQKVAPANSANNVITSIHTRGKICTPIRSFTLYLPVLKDPIFALCLASTHPPLHHSLNVQMKAKVFLPFPWL